MLQSVEHNAKPFLQTPEVLQKDFDVVVAALASSASFQMALSLTISFGTRTTIGQISLLFS